MIKPSFVIIGFALLMVSAPVCAMERFALTVGHEYGTPGEEPLRFANRDARRVRNVLVKLGGVEKKNAKTLENPGHRTLERAIRELGKRAAASGESNMLFFFFAGHGDEHSIHLGKHRLKRETLLKWLNAFPAKLKVVIVDSCQTTSVSRVRGVRAGGDFDIGIVQVPNHQGTVMISSSSKGEPAHESDLLEGAIFTHFMVSALLGSADVDHDGRISLQEAFTYSYRNTVRHSARGAATVQHPSFNFDIDGSGEIVLTHPASANAVLVLPAQKDGSYLVFKETSGTVVAEVMTGSGKPVTLAVPTGRLLVQRRINGTFQLADVNMPYGGRRVLQSSDFKNIPYEKTLLRGNTKFRQNANFMAAEGLGGAEFIDGKGVPKWGPRIQYTRTFRNELTVGPLVTLAFANYENATLVTRRQNLEFGLLFAKRFPLGVMDLRIGVIPLFHIRWQQRTTALDKERLESAGLELPKIKNTTLAAGGAFQIGLLVPVYENFYVVFSIECAFVAMKMKADVHQRWTGIPSMGGAIGAGTIF